MTVSDDLERKFFDAYIATQLQSTIGQLKAMGVSAEQLLSTANDLIKDAASEAAADLRARLPEHYRMAYCDRRHWCEESDLGPVVAADFEPAARAAIERLTVDGLVAEVGDWKLVVHVGGA